jgi:hypothetical protein
MNMISIFEIMNFCAVVVKILEFFIFPSDDDALLTILSILKDLVAFVAFVKAVVNVVRFAKWILRCVKGFRRVDILPR